MWKTGVWFSRWIRHRGTFLDSYLLCKIFASTGVIFRIVKRFSSWSFDSLCVWVLVGKVLVFTNEACLDFDQITPSNISTIFDFSKYYEGLRSKNNKTEKPCPKWPTEPQHAIAGLVAYFQTVGSETRESNVFNGRRHAEPKRAHQKSIS